jgi:bifunctional DNA-binding transcriptional regulator/antitoxin component of YhaV-PrlF toxin-antitoxin module
MDKTRVEVNEHGDFYSIIPEDVAAELSLTEGDQLEWDEEGGIVVLTLA